MILLLLACTARTPTLPASPPPLPDLAPAPSSPALPGEDPGAVITEEIRARFQLATQGSGTQ